jgi:Sec-independent protein translocase protein TatA
VLGVSWLEIVVVALLIGLLIGTGRVATFVRGVKRGMRDDDPGIRVKFIDRGDEDKG